LRLSLPMLVEHYLRRFNRELGCELREITPEAMETCGATRGRETSASFNLSLSRRC